jgi:hypothetical protein
VQALQQLASVARGRGENEAPAGHRRIVPRRAARRARPTLGR